ncbi:hypothetical protein ABFA07_016133 [Porites harrisoni]
MLQLKYLLLDSLYGSVWVGLWMILTGVIGIIASFNRAPAGQMKASVLAFIAFTISSTTLCLEIVGYYIYTFTASWDVYQSSRSYLNLSLATYSLAVVELILGVFAAIFGFFFIAHRGRPRGNQVATMPDNEGEDLWDENSQQQMDQVNPPEGFVAGKKRVYRNIVNGDERGRPRGNQVATMPDNEGEDLWDENSQQQMDQVNPPNGFAAEMKRVYKNTVNGDEWGLRINHDRSLYYYKIIRGEARDEILPQNQPLPDAPVGYKIMSRKCYRKRRYDEEWFFSREHDGQVSYYLLGHGETTLELPPVLSQTAEEAAEAQSVQENDAGQVLSQTAEEAAETQAVQENDGGQAVQENDAGQAEIWILGRPAGWNELPRKAIREHHISLGQGLFGVVNRGEVQTYGIWKPCAIKGVRNGTYDRHGLREELKIMGKVGIHRNIISLIGACTRDEPILLVLSLAENGSLKDYLETHREKPISRQDKIKIAKDVANGMSHLSGKRYVHRELAARNVLLNRNNVAMVSSFGLSRDAYYESGSYDQTPGTAELPIRWMAIESLKNWTYTTESDVWSFGVVMWEIESGGKVPYSDLRDRREILESLTNGRRLEQPPGCSNEIYEIMRTCWRENPLGRRTFGDLSTLLEQQLQKVTRVSMQHYGDDLE